MLEILYCVSKKNLGEQVPKQHLPSLCVPAPGERDWPVSPGSGHSGKNHEHQQLPEVHHHVYEIKKWDSFQWCWWAPAYLPKYYSPFTAIPRDKTNAALPTDKCCATNLCICAGEKKSHWTAKKAMKPHSYGAIHQPAHPSWLLEVMDIWFCKAHCTHLRPTVALFHKLAQFSVFLLWSSSKEKIF